MPPDDVVLVQDSSALTAAISDLAELSTLGVDVERADGQRYWRSAALVQVGGHRKVALVDPMVIEDLSPLDAFLSERTVVLHAMENDLGPLSSAGIELGRIEDTSIAAALLGMPTGLETLLADVLGVHLSGDKAAMQRADWEQRPLTAEMVAYAAGDVADLPALWGILADRLDEAGRMPWYTEERDHRRLRLPDAERRTWTAVRGVGRLRPAARARARSLWQAREELARTTDTAPARIMTDRVLVDLATAPVSSPHELGRHGVRRQAVRRFGHQLLEAINRPAGEGEPPPPQVRRPTERDRERADRLRALRSRRADGLHIDPGVLCPGRVLLGALLQDPGTPDALRQALGLRDWQWQQVGYDFCEALDLTGPGKPAAVHDDAEEHTDE